MREPWGDRLAFYQAACDAALLALGPGRGRHCLVVGSPTFEAEELERRGWLVTYLDCRQPPRPAVVGDAARLPFADACFDAASSTCVLCHVGLGRYGDPVRPGGDRAALAEMGRVLRPGAKAAVMFGPAFPGMRMTVVYGTAHRVYCEEAALGMAEEAGFRVLRRRFWHGAWLDDGAERSLRLELLREARRAQAAGDEGAYRYAYLAAELEKE